MNNLRLRCEIRRTSTPTDTAWGEQVESYAVLAAVAACSEPWAGRGNLKYTSEGVAQEAQWSMQLEAGQDVKAFDELVIDGDTVVYKVVFADLSRGPGKNRTVFLNA